MSETQVQFVQPQAFTINFVPVSAPVAVGTESNKIIVVMRMTPRPRDNVMHVDFNVSASGDRASMAGFDQNATSDFSRHWRAPLFV